MLSTVVDVDAADGTRYKIQHSLVDRQLKIISLTSNYRVRVAKIKRRHFTFLADRTNGRAIATLLRLSSVVVCL